MTTPSPDSCAWDSRCYQPHPTGGYCDTHLHTLAVLSGDTLPDPERDAALDHYMSQPINPTAGELAAETDAFRAGWDLARATRSTA